MAQGELIFPERTVLMARASVERMQRSMVTLNSIAELRRPKEPADFFDSLERDEQAEWLDDFLDRARFAADGDDTPYACLLDTGVNRGHPLIAPALDAGGCSPIAAEGGLSPFSTTSVTWDRHWPLKPDVVFEGGNAAKDPFSAVWLPSLSLLTTHHLPANRLFTTANATSAATALASRFTARISRRVSEADQSGRERRRRREPPQERRGPRLADWSTGPPHSLAGNECIGVTSRQLAAGSMLSAQGLLFGAALAFSGSGRANAGLCRWVQSVLRRPEGKPLQVAGSCPVGLPSAPPRVRD